MAHVQISSSTMSKLFKPTHECLYILVENLVDWVKIEANGV